MPWFDFIWIDENMEHIAQHDLTPEDVQHVVMNPEDEVVSRSSKRPAVKGHTVDGRYIFVAYEKIDAMTVFVTTAYEIDE